jgi:hypothetical protein
MLSKRSRRRKRAGRLVGHSAYILRKLAHVQTEEKGRPVSFQALMNALSRSALTETEVALALERLERQGFVMRVIRD